MNLITDRTSGDLNSLFSLRQKIMERTATPEEWSEWLLSPQGAYNATDLNRLGEAVQYLADLLHSYGYSVTVSPKTDWLITDIPRIADMTAYLSDIQAIKDTFYGTTPLPDDMDDLSIEAANNIERLLAEVEQYINQMTAAWFYSNEIYAGEV